MSFGPPLAGERLAPLPQSVIPAQAGIHGRDESWPSPGRRSLFARFRSDAPSDESDYRDIPTYYDLPSLKQSFYGWKVSAYIWVAGIAGSSQILATAAEFTDPNSNQSLIRHARYIALGGTVVGSVLLI